MDEKKYIGFAVLGAVAWIVMICGASILGLIYGWGLEPQSWPWIIGSYAVTIAAAFLKPE